MKRLQQQELFEIETLSWLKNNGFLKDIIFGGGTMLRLCHGLNRYSVDLDFWLYDYDSKEINSFFEILNKTLIKDYIVTDSQNKYYTLLFEIKKTSYPQKLKIEIRKRIEKADFQEKIAYSKFGNIQVVVKGFTLEQVMKNKTEALLGRKEIRDAFDIEFLLRNGIELPADTKKLKGINEIIKSFKKRDYSVTLGSLLDPQTREYYRQNGFSYLAQTINQRISY